MGSTHRAAHLIYKVRHENSCRWIDGGRAIAYLPSCFQYLSVTYYIDEIDGAEVGIQLNGGKKVGCILCK